MLFAIFLTIAQPDLPKVGVPSLPKVAGTKAKKAMTYEEGVKLSIASGKPVAVYVGQPAKETAGYLVCEATALQGYPAKCIVYCRPEGGKLWHERTVTPTTASPFVLPRNRVDAEPIAASSLPDSLAWLLNLENYTPARRVQFSTRRWSGAISSVSRDRLELKWNVPGGLAGVYGWSSQLYRSKGMKARTFLKRQDPSDDSSTVTWDREYPDGAIFVDLLRNDAGDIFEARVSEKIGGTWDRYIAYRNPSANPAGYVRPTSQQCRGCHARAGASEYQEAAIPGGDTILSDPMGPVENGGYVQGGFGTNL